MAAKGVVPIGRAQNDRARLELLRAHGVYEAAGDPALTALLETLRTAFEAPYAALFARHAKTFAVTAFAGDLREADGDALQRFVASVTSSEDDVPKSTANGSAFFCAAPLSLRGTIVPAALCIVANAEPSANAVRQLASVCKAYGAILEATARSSAAFDLQIAR